MQDGNTALINAAAAGHLDVITLLLYAGADIDRTNHVITTPLPTPLFMNSCGIHIIDV